MFQLLIIWFTSAASSLKNNWFVVHTEAESCRFQNCYMEERSQVKKIKLINKQVILVYRIPKRNFTRFRPIFGSIKFSLVHTLLSLKNYVSSYHYCSIFRTRLFFWYWYFVYSKWCLDFFSYYQLVIHFLISILKTRKKIYGKYDSKCPTF